jgi:hypothetical protein
VEKLPRLNWTIQFLMLVNVTLMFLSEWHEFPSAPCFAKKRQRKTEKQSLLTAHVLMLLKWRTLPECFISASATGKDLQFGT